MRKKIRARNPKTERVTIRFSKRDLEALKGLAKKKTEGNVSRLVRYYVMRGMKENV
jgi:predicted DNA binding CopG/RHH family protein